MSAPSAATAHHPFSALALVQSALELVVIVLFTITFVVQPLRVPTESMQPTIFPGDFMLMDKQSFAPENLPGHTLLPSTNIHRGDLAVFSSPTEPGATLVKRIIALPGERIHMHHGQVFLNGTALAEPYAFYSSATPNGFRDEFPSLREADPNADPLWWIALRRSLVDGEITVPANAYFVLGDNRNDSEDSRYWGFVPQTMLLGRPLLVYVSAGAAGEHRGIRIPG
jgi:signal peptidase I